MNFTQKVWSITDLIGVIGSFKKLFEHASDIEKLNESTAFQHLVFHVFGHTFDSSLIVRHKGAERVLYDPLLLPFFWNDNEMSCKV